eukprot:1148097-Pelagomonas_calceolata.AAC.6
MELLICFAADLHGTHAVQQAPVNSQSTRSPACRLTSADIQPGTCLPGGFSTPSRRGQILSRACNRRCEGLWQDPEYSLQREVHKPVAGS